MNPDWAAVEAEMLYQQRLSRLSPLALDTLHGSMWGLNHRYMSIEQAMQKDGERILQYSLRRVGELAKGTNFTFRKRRPPHCRVGLGTYGWKYDPEIIREAIRRGVPLIDTAEGYGYGRVETALGEALKKSGPVEVATKVRRDHMSSKAINNAARRSKTKLGTTPHMQIHFPHLGQPEVLADLVKLRRSGVIQSIGLGNCSVDMIEAAQRFLSTFSGDVVRSVQVRFNLLDQRIKGALLPYCQERGILVIAYSPLGQRFRDLVRPALKEIAQRRRCVPAQIALGWILAHPGVMPIPRTNSVPHLKKNMTRVVLNESDMEMLKEAYP